MAAPGKRARKVVPTPAKRSARTVDRTARRRKQATRASAAELDRREAILEAALDVFGASGFAAARLDDVAAKAGVAKGTLYLYFPNKQALFEELIRGLVLPLLDEVAAAADTLPPNRLFEHFFEIFEREILGTRRRLVLRLLICEGHRFPAIAEFYYSHVVQRGLKILRNAARRARSSHGRKTAVLESFPQLIVAPLIVSIVWDGLFGRIDPLDTAGLLKAHRQVLAALLEPDNAS